MDFKEFKALVLVAITDHDRKWTWYTLDRHLSRTNPEMMGGLMPALRELEAEGKIRSIPQATIPGMPRYELNAEAQ